MMDNLRNVYIEEANELLSALETALLALDENSNDLFYVEEIFRVMHTLKGNSSMFGFTAIAEFLHNLETTFDNIRTKQAPVEKQMLNCTFAALDHLRNIVHDPNLEITENRKQHEELLTRLTEYFSTETIEEKKQPAQAIAPKQKTMYIRFEPSPDFLGTGSNPLLLLDELAALGKCKTVPHFKNEVRDDNYNPEKCLTWWDIYLETHHSRKEIEDVFIFAAGNAAIHVEELPLHNVLASASFSEAVMEGIYLDRETDLQALIRLDAHAASHSSVTGNITPEVPSERPEKKTGSKIKTAASIRVSSDKLDELMNLVSELVTTQAGLSLYTENNKIPELETITENVVKLSRRLRDVAFGMTLVPVNNMFGRFQRMVRDISAQLGKDIDFITEGGETELDKTIIETLTDPLMHVLRNALDHGIEKPEERVKKGKPARGTVKLKAYYSGAFVNIQISDDGNGMDHEMIRKVAIEKGILDTDDVLSREELLQVIFYPGFSTASEITDVSGRGVGMDVVKKNITDMKGHIRIESMIHEGSTITIQLPLTLSIIDGLLVSVDDVKYIIPLNAVIKCHEVRNELLLNNFNRLLLLDDQQIPFINLREEFRYHQSGGLSQVIVVNHAGNEIGICVDFIVGEYQAVIKPLGKYYRRQDFVSGATILGDGTIALVLDVAKTVELSIVEKNYRWQ